MLKIRKHSKLWIYFTSIIFVTVCAVFILINLLWHALFAIGYMSSAPHRAPLLFFALGSLLLGITLAICVGRLIIRPLQSMSNAFDELSKGNFDVKISEKAHLAEIREMAQCFNAMTYDLAHIETLRSDFVANVSHEFKTPIAAIEGYATLLQDPGLTQAKHDHYVQKILENSHRLGSMSGNILLLSKLENRETLPQRAEYRLDEQIRQCILALEGKWTAREINWDIELENITYYGSQALLEQVWLNLLDNAIKHTHIGGPVAVTAKRQGGKITVAVADRGDGMSQEVQKHIFEKFYQGDRSRTDEGNGLGLALVKRIIDLCKGSVTVQSAPSLGATFTVELPDSK